MDRLHVTSERADQPVSGQLLAPAAPQLHTSTTWVDVLTGEHVRVELRESTLAPETDTDRVRQAAADAQNAWIRANTRTGHGTWSDSRPATPDETARLFGQRHGGNWKVAQPWNW